MIKSLKKYQVQLTPFEATKDWALNNFENQNLLLTEDDWPIALEFLDYGDGTELPQSNTFCDIALEQQDDDRATIEEGLKVTGPFYPDTDPQNQDKTYQRPIWYQVRAMFYDNFLNPTQVWGSENIDFELSKTKRKLADKFRLYDLPRNVFGDKMTPKTINLYDNSLDDAFDITDDGNGNLFAGTEIFSHKQEVGDFLNGFITGSNHYCDWYWANGEIVYRDYPTLTMSFWLGEMIDWLKRDSASVRVGFSIGNVQDFPVIDYPVMSMSFARGYSTQSAFPVIITGSYPAETSSLSVSFAYGDSEETVQVITSSFDSSSLSASFVSGSYNLTTFVETLSFDSTSMNMNFVSGNYNFTTYVQTMSFHSASLGMLFRNGIYGP